MSNLTDVDLLLTQIEVILSDLGVKDSDSSKKIAQKVDNITDKFKLDIEDLIKDLLVLFDEKDRILASTDPKQVVAKKYLNDQKIDENLNKMHESMRKFKQELDSYKKKKRKVTYKIKNFHFSKEKNQQNITKMSLKISMNNTKYSEKNGKINIKVEEQKKNLNTLDIILLDDSKFQNKEPERGAYQEEKDKINEWNKAIEEQDNDLSEVALDLKNLKVKSKDIGKNIDLSAKMIDKTNNQADRTDAELKRSSKQLKEILDRVGGPTNFCVDVVLICICLGLCAVLYNIFKNKILK